jgi:hypothetical protein
MKALISSMEYSIDGFIISWHNWEMVGGMD